MKPFANLRDGMEQHTYQVEQITEDMAQALARVEGFDRHVKEDSIEVVTYGGEVEALE